MIKSVLLLEDIPETSELLSRLLLASFEKVDIAKAFTVQSALDILSNQAFDLAIIDLNLPDGDGTTVISELSTNHPSTFPVVATIFEDDSHLFSALRAGARGYLLKEQDEDQIVDSLKGILDGRPPLSPYIAQRILGTFKQEQKVEDNSSLESLSEEEANKQGILTIREQEVLTLLAKGFARGEIAEYLTISKNTVCTHIKRIYRKLSINSASQASIAALNMGLITKDIN